MRVVGTRCQDRGHKSRYPIKLYVACQTYCGTELVRSYLNEQAPLKPYERSLCCRSQCPEAGEHAR